MIISWFNVFNTGECSILHILKSKWWMYLLMALTDVEANYTVVKAYQFTTLTSIQVFTNHSPSFYTYRSGEVYTQQM